MKTKYGNKLTGKIIFKIFITTIIYTLSLIVIWYVGKFICDIFVWQPYDMTYQFLQLFRNMYVLLFIWLLGFIIIFIYYLRKALSYLDSMVSASSLLVNEDDEWIKLPSDLIQIEEKMNQVKQQSRKNYKLAKENEQRKDDLIVYLAHDIKTPLTSMIGYLSLLDEVDDMPKNNQKKYIKVALEKSYKLEELVNELFDITRFNSEKIILEKEEINLNMMMEQIIDDFYPTLKECNKEIKVIANERVILNGDSNKLARVFNNVIKNAINYSTDNTNIIVEILNETTNAKVIISNQGKKINDEKLKRIFEKFYRVDSSRTSKTGGSGLGLAIAKEIIELHNGKIYATSDNKQTKFYISIPIDEP